MTPYSAPFLLSILDTVSDQIAVIEWNGNIIFVNESWRIFARNNESSTEVDWLGQNYIDAVQFAANSGDEDARKLMIAFDHLKQGVLEEYYYEYPCHSPEELRWFLMSVKTLDIDGESVFVISHKDITERRLAEEKAHNLSKTDWLTGLDNRRSFEERVDKEWRRSVRLKQSISIVMIDIDHFKLLNDHYGHARGDDCLCLVSSLLNRYAKRPGDILARYGGEEFILALGNTAISEAESIVRLIMDGLDEMKIENINSSVKPFITVSAGLVSIHPKVTDSLAAVIREADSMLYRSKVEGRNRMSSTDLSTPLLT